MSAARGDASAKSDEHICVSGLFGTTVTHQRATSKFGQLASESQFLPHVARTETNSLIPTMDCDLKEGLHQREGAQPLALRATPNVQMLWASL